MRSFAPKDMSELCRNLSEMTENGRIIAGGTDLVIRLNMEACTPDSLLYLGGVRELSRIETHAEYVEIGAMATMSDIARSDLLGGPFAALRDAAGDVGSTQIRNSATVGGNVANASAAGDMLPVLFLLGAEAEIACPGGGTRRLPMRELVTGPGRTSLAYNEAITAFRVPLLGEPSRVSAFRKLGFRKSVTISRIGLGISAVPDGSGAIERAEVIAGAISTTPLRVSEAEAALAGARADEAHAIHAVGKALSDLIMKVTPEIFDRDYKVGAAYGIAEDALSLLRRRIAK